MIGPFLSLLSIQKFGMSESRAAVLVAAPGIGNFLGLLTGGRLADTFGRRPTMLLGLMFAAFFAFALIPTREFLLIIFILFGFGFSSSLVSPALNSMIADCASPEMRPQAYALNRVGHNLGFCLAMIVGGFLMDRDYRLLFWFDGLSALAFALVVYRYLKETGHKGRTSFATPVGELLSEKSKVVLHDRPYLLFCLAMFIQAMVYFSHTSVLPLSLVKNFAFSNADVGRLLAINGFLVVLFEVAIATAFSKRQPLKMIALGCVLVGLGLGLTGLSGNVAWQVFCLMIWTSGEIAMSPFVMAAIAGRAPPDRRGQYMGLAQSCVRAALALGPLVFLPLYGVMDSQFFWPFLGVLILPSVGLFLYLNRYFVSG